MRSVAERPHHGHVSDEHGHAVHALQGVPPAYVKCFTEYLRAAGYYCTNNNKTDYNFDVLPLPGTTPRGAHWRNRSTKETPFFAVINLTQTHESQVRLPAAQLAARRKTLAPHELHDPAKAPLPPYYPDTPLVRRDMANLYDNITFTDKLIGGILKDLADDGLADKTIVFFCGDHGGGSPRLQALDLRFRHAHAADHPLARQAGAGSVNDELSPSSISLRPVLNCGVEIPKHMQGRAFLGEEPEPPREYVYAARDRMDEALDIIRGVRDKRFHYLPQLSTGSALCPTHRLHG